MLLSILMLILIKHSSALELTLYDHVLVKGIHRQVSVDANGTVTVVSADNKNTINDIDVIEIVNLTHYQQSSQYDSLACSFNEVVDGTKAACMEAVALSVATRAIKQSSQYDYQQTVSRIAQSMFLAGDSKRRRLGSNDFDELNAVFQGLVLKIPEQAIEKKIWPSTLKIKMTSILCSQISIQDVSINSKISGSDVVSRVEIQNLAIKCSAKYRYDWGWVGGNGVVSAGGTRQSIDTILQLSADGQAKIQSCSSNIDLTHLSFSGGIVASIADTFKGLFRGSLENILKTTICDELSPLGSTLITDLATSVKTETDPYVPTNLGGSYVQGNVNAMQRENALQPKYQESLVSWENLLVKSTSTDPIALLVPDVFKAIDAYLGKVRTSGTSSSSSAKKKDLGINHVVRSFLLETAGEHEGLFLLDFINATNPEGVILYSGIDPLTSTTLSIEYVTVKGLDTWITFQPLKILGHQTIGHLLEMKGKLEIAASLRLQIGPSTAPDSLIQQHQGVTVSEKPSLSIAIEDLKFDAATYLAVSSEEILSLKLGAMVQTPIECFSSTIDELVATRFLATVSDVFEPLLSGFLSVGIDRLFSQALHTVYLKYEQRMTAALPGFLTTTGSNMLNTLVSEFLQSNNQRYTRTCPDPVIQYNDKVYVNFQTNEFWNTFRSIALKPLLGDDGKYLNDLIVNATDSGSIHNILGDNMTKTSIDTGANMLGLLSVSAGNIGVHHLNTVHSIELLTSHSKHRDTSFAGINDWNTVVNNETSPFELTSSLAVGTQARPIGASIDVYLGVAGGDSNKNRSFENDFTLSLSVSELELFLQIFAMLDLGHLENLQLRHITKLDCWISTVGRVAFQRVRVHVKGLLFPSIKCRHCTSPGFLGLQTTLSTPEAKRDLTNIVNRVLNFTSNIIESDEVQQTVDDYIAQSDARCTLASNGYAPDGSQRDTTDLIITENGTVVDSSAVAVSSNAAVIDYTLFAMSGVLIGAIMMCFRFAKKERTWQNKLLQLEKELDGNKKAKKSHHGNKDKNKNKSTKVSATKDQQSPLIFATRSLFQSPHVPFIVRYGIPIVLIVNWVLFLSGHLSLGALVRVKLQVAGENIVIPSVFTFSMAQSTIDMWMSGAKMLAVILVLFSGVWPYTKVFITLFLWFAPPQTYAPSSRGSAFMWLDALGKWSCIDIFVLVLSMVGFHIVIHSPEVTFLPPTFYKVEVQVIPCIGLYANLLAQILSQIVSHVAIYYHRNAVAAAEQATGNKLLDMKSVKKILQQQELGIMRRNPLARKEIATTKSKPKKTTTRKRASTTWIHSADTVEGPRSVLVSRKAPLRSHYFEMHSDTGEAGQIGRLRIQVSPCGQICVVILILITEICFLIGTVSSSYKFDTRGVAGAAINMGQSDSAKKEYSILTTVENIAGQSDDDVSSMLGINSIAGIFLLCAVIIPSAQLIGLLVIWVVPFSLKNQKRCFLINEALGAWQYLEVYIIAIILSCLQMAEISQQIAKPLCSDLDATFSALASIGIMDEVDANCFVVLASVSFHKEPTSNTKLDIHV